MGHHTGTTETKTRPKIHHQNSHKSNHYKRNNSQRAGLLLSKKKSSHHKTVNTKLNQTKLTTTENCMKS